MDAHHRPWKNGSCLHDENPPLSFWISLYCKPWKAKKRFLIKLSIKLHVAIKRHRPQHTGSSVALAWGLPSLYSDWGLLSPSSPTTKAQNKSPTIICFTPIYSHTVVIYHSHGLQPSDLYFCVLTNVAGHPMCRLNDAQIQKLSRQKHNSHRTVERR